MAMDNEDEVINGFATIEPGYTLVKSRQRKSWVFVSKSLGYAPIVYIPLYDDTIRARLIKEDEPLPITIQGIWCAKYQLHYPTRNNKIQEYQYVGDMKR